MLNGRNAVVTGGSRGIGRAVVERLCRAGATVVFGYATHQAAANDVVRAVAAAGGAARAPRADPAEQGAAERLLEDAEKLFDGLGILCATPPVTCATGGPA
ncbi:SDR family NAD(P)-dependent oxidoreductase [Streptomyces radicis]|uniref:SDR family NAD(P)-dependent oxidoreductase n=1 Tax=Streptomyces radicis TaxID=1750517 RepID=A0A3A9W1Q6_9ACTN|nr:SDR family NAD(P)-dependent oxidoreductase [Streptomyces radicis]RKN15914.1 SDR family NAD(P)-dependent oxidoreductase [Streptomyces radicis]